MQKKNTDVIEAVWRTSVLSPPRTVVGSDHMLKVLLHLFPADGASNGIHSPLASDYNVHKQTIKDKLYSDVCMSRNMSRPVSLAITFKFNVKLTSV